MTPQSALEIQGTLITHPFAELLVEIGQARLNGSLRISDGDRKCAVYFKSGQAVFAASNERSTRVFEMLLSRGSLKKDDLAKIPNFGNDFEITKFLVDKNVISQQERDNIFHEQVQAIALDILCWKSGDWIFSPLARIRDGLAFQIEMTEHLVNYSRCLGETEILDRFRTLDETFTRNEGSGIGSDLTLEEGFVLSRAEKGSLSASELIILSGMPDGKVLHILYTLWLGGLLIRGNWNPAFSRNVISAIKNARLELRSEPTAPRSEPASPRMPEVADDKVLTPEPGGEKQAGQNVTLEQYLTRVENAATFYDILGVDTQADTDALKRAYFWLAKNFHPDRYHAEGGATLKRIQNAFTELAQAHETLKNKESREVYDYRVRKELANREKQRETGETGTQQIKREQGTENFDRGLSLLMENDPNAAVPFLARAAHFQPQNARYRAYYGRALAFDDKQRFKAEAELQAALKLDPDNPTFRIMLAEFFIQFNLLKRAEGELNRLLAIFPSNREAKELLQSLKNP